MLAPKGTATPKPIEPVAETYEEFNFPYRGPEDHGVPVYNEEYEPEEELALDTDPPQPTEYDEPFKEPVLVEVVESSRRVLRRMRVANITVNNVPLQVLGQDDNRLRVLVKVIATAEAGYVYLSDAQHSCTAMSAYQIAAGETVELLNDNAVYLAHSDADATLYAQVCYIEEFNIFVESD